MLVNQYDKLDTSKLEASMKIRADSLMKKGESLCLRDRYEHGVEAMREALDVVGVKPKI